jgi:hypothetical protein
MPDCHESVRLHTIEWREGLLSTESARVKSRKKQKIKNIKSIMMAQIKSIKVDNTIQAECNTQA